MLTKNIQRTATIFHTQYTCMIDPKYLEEGTSQWVPRLAVGRKKDDLWVMFGVAPSDEGISI